MKQKEIKVLMKEERNREKREEERKQKENELLLRESRRRDKIDNIMQINEQNN